jgi:hypothetical protein
MKHSWRVFEALTDEQFEEIQELAESYRYTETDLEYASSDDPIWDYRRELRAAAASILFTEGEFEFDIHTRKSGEVHYQCHAKLTYRNGATCGALGDSTKSFFDALARAIGSQAGAAIEPDNAY